MRTIIAGSRTVTDPAWLDRALAKYRQWIVLQPELYLAAKRELAGRDLVCFCAPEACHGDVTRVRIYKLELPLTGVPTA